MTDKEKLSEVVRLAYGMYYAAQYLTTDASRLHKAMEDYHQFIINDYCKEEPASEDLEQASRNYADDEEYGDDVYFSIKAAFKAGAQWQEKKDIEDSFKSDWTMPNKFFEAGKDAMKKELMKDAFEAQVSFLANERTGRKQIKTDLPMGIDIDFGEIVKVIIVKE